MRLFESDKSATRLPVLVITGFLGSGKTTLLNRLLRHPEMSDSAVIINEWGEIGIDHLLVATIDGEVAVMSSGCLCCTLRSDLEATLRGLLVRRDRGEVPPFRRVLLETTGHRRSGSDHADDVEQPAGEPFRSARRGGDDCRRGERTASAG